jgi:hypothetical protein
MQAALMQDAYRPDPRGTHTLELACLFQHRGCVQSQCVLLSSSFCSWESGGYGSVMLGILNQTGPLSVA